MPTAHPTTRAALVLSASAVLACFGGGNTQPVACLDYLECVGEESPSMVTTLARTYGKDGSCWDMGKDERELCEAACVMGLTACAEGDSDSDSDADISAVWDSNGVTVSVTGVPTSGFDFGMAETGDMTNGWFGEDCLNGTASYRMCHSFSSRTGQLEGVTSLDAVMAGQTTLFREALASRITYIVTVAGGDCYVWGHQPSYYLSEPSFATCERL